MTAPPNSPTPSSPRRTLRCRTVAESGSRHHNHIRGLAPILVEERFGSSDEGAVASPPEALLAALGSCLSARIHANAAAGSIRVNSLELQVEVDVGANPLWDPPGIGTRAIGFEAIRVVVHMNAEASPEAIRALVAHAVLWSPVAQYAARPRPLGCRSRVTGNITAEQSFLSLRGEVLTLRRTDIIGRDQHRRRAWVTAIIRKWSAKPPKTCNH